MQALVDGLTSAVSVVARPVLDSMQTTPVFVYLIPAVFFFGVGVVPGVVATTIFAIAPGVRLTELGIRQVDREMVEAAHAFGARPRQVLRDVQLPMALPSIMAGVKKNIMLSLSLGGGAGAPRGAGRGRRLAGRAALGRVAAARRRGADRRRVDHEPVAHVAAHHPVEGRRDVV